MVISKIFAALAAIAQVSQAHYMFVRFSHNGIVEAPLGAGGIRNRTAPFEERFLYNANFYTRIFNDPHCYADYDESVRCGRGNMDWANTTAVIDVQAGDTLEIGHQRAEPSEWNENFFKGCPGGRITCDPRYYLDFNHPGPAIVHLSKVPEGQDVTTYDGSGEWVKIHSSGMKIGKNGTYSWPLYNVMGLDIPRITFKIPKQTPAGQYLMRMDVPWAGNMNPYVHHGQIITQMYPSCAQLNVKSDVTGSLPKGVQIPQIFTPEGPGMEISYEMYKYEKIDEDYEYPGGPLWDGEKLIIDKPIIATA